MNLNKKYIYTFKTTLGREIMLCADNLKEIGKVLDLDLGEIIDRKSNAMHELSQSGNQ